MISGCPGWRPWPDHLHHWHSKRRWQEARYAYRQEHPVLAEQEFAEIISRPRGGRKGGS